MFGVCLVYEQLQPVVFSTGYSFPQQTEVDLQTSKTGSFPDWLKYVVKHTTLSLLSEYGGHYSLVRYITGFKNRYFQRRVDA